MSTSKQDSTCKNCSHWRNKQSELDYSGSSGICTCFKWLFKTTGINDDALVLDRSNKTEKFMHTNRFESQNKDMPVGGVNPSRYCLVTGENFGCIHFDKKQK